MKKKINKISICDKSNFTFKNLELINEAKGTKESEKKIKNT